MFRYLDVDKVAVLMNEQDLRWPTYALRELTLESVVPDERGNGALRVCDLHGRTYLDAVNGVGCAPLGHAHELWVTAIHKQLQQLTSVANSFFTRPQQQLAARLAALLPVNRARVFFCNSGTEATEAAIKLAIKSTGRSTIIVFERAFHGRTLGALSLTANLNYRHPYVQCEGESEQAAFCQARVIRLPFNDMQRVRDVFASVGKQIAAVFVEAIQGEAGVYPATKEFLCTLHQLCRHHGALLGIDDVQAGCGRTGTWSAWTQIVGDDPQIRPDILWVAKALGGGFPIGACLAEEKIAQTMGKGSHGTTFGGNPLACTAALATLRIIEEEGLLHRAHNQLLILQEIAQKNPIAQVSEIRGAGAMIGIQIGEPSQQVATAVGNRLMHEHGILVTVCGGHTIRLLLPYRAGQAELVEIWTALAKICAAERT